MVYRQIYCTKLIDFLSVCDFHWKGLSFIEAEADSVDNLIHSAVAIDVLKGSFSPVQ